MQNTLHDRNVIAIDAMENDLVMRLQSGILETASLVCSRMRKCF